MWFKQVSDRELAITYEVCLRTPVKLESSQVCLRVSSSHVAVGRSDMVCVSLWDMGRLMQLFEQKCGWQESQNPKCWKGMARKTFTIRMSLAFWRQVPTRTPAKGTKARPASPKGQATYYYVLHMQCR
jgi:hypothetical protein